MVNIPSIGPGWTMSSAEAVSVASPFQNVWASVNGIKRISPAAMSWRFPVAV
jgi:hypothetical protein